MGLADFLQRLLQGSGHGVDELARRLGVDEAELRAVEPSYREFTIPKRSGGKRTIAAPDEKLKRLQRLLQRRLLARLKCHPAATGFERGYSIVLNAMCHVGRAVVVRMDLRDFFPSTSSKRVERFFREVGWNRAAAGLLVKLCTRRGGLPQGAPTSPRLSNLVNYRLDARLAGLAQRLGAVYTRYADDLTFSFASDDREAIHSLVRTAKRVVEREGYAMHVHKKLRIARRHDRQLVTGLVVNERVNLPRARRRWLRAVEHRAANGRAATLTEAQLAGWRALGGMIEQQAGRSG